MTTNQQNFYQLNLAYLHAARELTRIAPQRLSCALDSHATWLLH